MDGVAHSQMVLADVSSVGKDSKTGDPYRNANVMYEVGLALACRQPQEVLLIRDDHDQFLFDVSTIPHMTLDFTDVAEARNSLHVALVARLRERDLVHDARVRRAIDGLSSEEVLKLRQVAEYSPTTVWGPKDEGKVDFFHMAAIPRLAGLVGSHLRSFKADDPTQKPEDSDTEEGISAGDDGSASSESGLVDRSPSGDEPVPDETGGE